MLGAATVRRVQVDARDDSLTVAPTLELRTVGDCFVAAYTYRPRPDAPPEALGGIELLRMKRRIGSFPRAWRGTYRRISYDNMPALLVFECTSQRALRDLDYELAERSFYPLAVARRLGALGWRVACAFLVSEAQRIATRTAQTCTCAAEPVFAAAHYECEPRFDADAFCAHARRLYNTGAPVLEAVPRAEPLVVRACVRLVARRRTCGRVRTSEAAASFN